MSERFISEAIVPDGDSFDTARMASGEPGLPQRFSWRGQEYGVDRVLRTWKDTGPCRHGSGERYVRKHWFELVTTSGACMKVYFERKSRGGNPGIRWWLFSIAEHVADPADRRSDH